MTARTPASRALALLLLLAAPSLAHAGETDAVARWLEQHPAAADRADPALLVLRRGDERLAARLVALAAEPARESSLRRHALELSQVLADDAALAPALDALAADAELGPAARLASSRLAARAAVLAILSEAAAPGSSPRAEDPRGPLASTSAAREVLLLARDPLLDAPRRRRAVLALPLGAVALKLDHLAVASEIARAPGEGTARVAALSVLGAATRAATPAAEIDAARARMVLGRTLGAIALEDDAGLARAVRESMPLLRDEAAVKAFAIAAIPEGARVAARARALELLGWTDARIASEWIERMLRDAVPLAEDEVRAAAVGALARLGARRPADAVAALVELLSSPRIEARARAIDSLRSLPRSLVEEAVRQKLELAPASADDPGPLHAAEAAAALELALAAPLGRLALDERSSIAARTAAARALALVGDPVTGADVLAKVLSQTRDSSVPSMASLRRAVAEALGAPGLRGEVALRALEGALGDPSGPVRIEAARSLGTQADPHAAAILVQAIDRSDLRPRERAAIVRALGSLGAWDATTAGRVAAALGEDASPEAAVAATEYFSGAPRDLAVPVLIDLLDHADLGVRLLAHATLLVLAGEQASVERNVDPFGYEAAANLTAERNAAIHAWREWWERHGGSDKGPK